MKNCWLVNGALNELSIEEGDCDAFRHSVDHFDFSDAINLARKLEPHECLNLRWIAFYLHGKAADGRRISIIRSLTVCMAIALKPNLPGGGALCWLF
jgi:hypothetical protein